MHSFPGIQDDKATNLALQISAGANARKKDADALALLRRLDRYFETHPIRPDLKDAIRRAVK